MKGVKKKKKYRKNPTWVDAAIADHYRRSSHPSESNHGNEYLLPASAVSGGGETSAQFQPQFR